MDKFSVVIIVKKRQKQLHNTLESITRSTKIPHDIHVIAMDDTVYDFSDIDLPITTTQLRSTETLPLGRARNCGARACSTDTIIFLDVDCIVAPTTFEALLGHLTPSTVVSAYPRYLPILPDSGDYEALAPLAFTHPDRASIPSETPAPYKKFWSLVFAVEKPTFLLVGGFDESFTGYGAEDTDFARAFNARGIELIFAKSEVLHQYHPKYDPPLEHFADIIINARRYKQKWGEFAMYGWLKKFAEMKLIALDEEIRILKQPTTSDIEACRSTNPY